MQEVGRLDADIQVALIDMERHHSQVVGECLKVWDSMGGKLPSFEGFCRMYVQEAFDRWLEKGRWN